MKIRPAVMRFAEAMERKLRKHDADRGDSWKTASGDRLKWGLNVEVDELDYAFATRDPDAVMLEAVDVANFAMFLWHATKRDQPRGTK